MIPLDASLERAFERQNRKTIRRNFIVASVVGMVLVPMFTFLDRGVYADLAEEFLFIRLGCSATIGLFLAMMFTPFGLKHYRALGVILVLLPATAISYMIYRTDGAASQYYAGLNLVLLVVGFILRWTFKDSLIAVGLVIAEFFVACYFQGVYEFQGANLHSYFFLWGTGIIVVVGNYWFTRLRYNEFSARLGLVRTKRKLKSTLAALEQAQEQLVQKGKAELLGQVSQNLVHDVGNLMQPVGNYLFKLKGMAGHLPEAKRASFADTLAKIERPMSAARGVLATLQRYAHGAPQMTHECSIASVIDDASQLVRATAEEAGVRLQCQVDRQFVVLGPPLDLTMVFKNLLDNAIAATKDKANAQGYLNEAPTICVESRLAAGRGYLVIRDNGVGIDPDGMAKLFTRYYSTKRDGNGTGLGLVGCKATVEKLGGTISVRSEVGQFTEFTVELPLPTIEPNSQTK